MIRVVIEVANGDFTVKTESREVSKAEVGLFLLAVRQAKKEVMEAIRGGME